MGCNKIYCVDYVGNHDPFLNLIYCLELFSQPEPAIFGALIPLGKESKEVFNVFVQPEMLQVISDWLFKAG